MAKGKGHYYYSTFGIKIEIHIGQITYSFFVFFLPLYLNIGNNIFILIFIEIEIDSMR